MNRTILYHTIKKRTVSPVLNDGYMVHGIKKAVQLPIVELNYIVLEQPELLENQTVKQTITITDSDYIIGWEVVEIEIEVNEII
jgi:hypothetical protein